MIISTRISIIFAFVASMAVHEAQAQTGRVFKQPAHTFLKDMSWSDSVYLYPDFRPGLITYFTGFTPERDLLLNYNLYFGQFDMIDAHGDTVQITPSKTFKSVSVGNDLFLFDQKEGYVRVMAPGYVTLAERILFLLVMTDYVSGSRTPGMSPDYDVRGRPSNSDLTFMQTSTYYFVDSQGKFFLANRTSLTKIFPEYKSAIHEFVRMRGINFSKEADVLQITQYCNGLRSIPSDSSRGIIVSANEPITRILRDSMYRFPEFQDGVVTYHDGQQKDYKAPLNYNLLSGEMEAIENGDTSKINYGKFVTTVNIDGTLYFKKPGGYVEILLYGHALLGVVRTLPMTHSQALEASSKYRPDDGYDPALAQNDLVNFDRMFTRKNHYYLVDGSGAVHEPSLSSFYRLYPKNKKQIDDYLALHQPDFRNENYLKQIMSYLASVKQH